MSRRAIISVLTFGSFVLITLMVVLLAQGCSLSRQADQRCNTGIIEVTSDPNNALVTLNGKSKGATDTSINVVSGTYDVVVSKDGYFPWQTQVSVTKNKVLTVDALLLPVSPSLAPISSTPAERPVLSPDGQKLAYSVTTGTSSGIWLLDLTAQPFNLAKKPTLLLQDTDAVKYSVGQLSWSPTSKELLISLDQAGLNLSYLLSTDNANNLTDVTTTVTDLKTRWATEQQAINQQLSAGLDNATKQILADNAATAVWSPDSLKFLYQTTEGDRKITYVYNKEAKSTSKAMDSDAKKFLAVRWYADSQHLMALDKDNLEAASGTVTLMGMDGTNQHQVFSGTLTGDVLYTYLNGSKLVILTSLNLQTPDYYLYSINLR